MQAASGQNRDPNRALPFLIVGTGLLLALLVGLFALPQLSSATLPSAFGAGMPAAVSYPAPPVALTDLQGHNVSLADYRGQVIIYNAWATWCPPCKQEMPTLQSYYEAHAAQGLVVIGIENGEPVQEVAEFARQYGLTFPIWPDARWQAAVAFKAVALPTSYVIDRGGSVRLTWLGAISRAMLDKYVTPLITEAQ